MSWQRSIEQLSHGELTPSEGMAIVKQAFAAKAARTKYELYVALRSFVWKALEARRRDDEIDAWADLITRASGKMDGDFSAKLIAYVELLQMSAMAAETEKAHKPLESRHARKISSILRHAPGPVSKKRIKTAMNLKDSTLTQIMAPLIDFGLVERRMVGREAEYELTAKGRADVDEINSVRQHRVPDNHFKPGIVRITHHGNLAHYHPRLLVAPFPEPKTTGMIESPSFGETYSIDLMNLDMEKIGVPEDWVNA